MDPLSAAKPTPTWGYHAGLALAGFSVLLGLYATQPVLAELAVDLHVPLEAAALTITASTLGVAVAAPVAGALADRFGRRRLAAPLIAVMAVPTAAAALAPNLEWLLALRFVHGLLLPLVFTGMIGYAHEEGSHPEFPRGTAARFNASWSAGAVLGGFSGRFVTGLAAEAGGWRAASWLLGGLTLAVSLGVALTLPRERRFVPSSGVGTAVRGMVAAGRNPRLLLTCVLGASLLFGQVATFSFGTLYLAGPPFGFSPNALGAVFTVFLTGLVTTPLAGWLVGRIGDRVVLAAALGLSWLGLLASWFPVPALVILGLACCATGTFVGQSCATAAAARHSPGSASAGAGVYLTSFYLGGGLGAIVPAPVWRWFGWPGTTLLVIGVLAVGLTAALIAWRDHPNGELRS